MIVELISTVAFVCDQCGEQLAECQPEMTEAVAAAVATSHVCGGGGPR